MEASTAPSVSQPLSFSPDTEAIKRKLLKKGVYPTPKIIHTLRKKEIQKHNRKLNKAAKLSPPLTPSQKQALAEESHFQTLKREYREFTKATKTGVLLVGRPWDRIERVRLKEIASGSHEFSGDKLKRGHLSELRDILKEDLRCVLDDEHDVGVEDADWFESENQQNWEPTRRRRPEGVTIQFLVNRLSVREVTVKDWKLAKIMKQSGLRFTEGQLMKIVEKLGEKGKWEQAMAVVEWVYNDKERRDCKSRFVHTKLLAILGKERRPQEALRTFNMMLEDCNIYPDMAAYHSIAVTLGQAGLLKELLKLMECMRQKPSRRIRNMRYKNWDPVIEPDLVVYNAVLNACVPSQQWKGVSWVFEQLRKSGLKPNGATYGLAMEVMLHSGKYDLVHEFFEKMNRSGKSPESLTYKVLVRAFWEEGKVNEAVEAVRDMEERGVVGKASVYYELACCLCNNGRWQDALLEVEKIKKLHHHKPLEYTFTGMIQSSIAGGHIDDCISIFEYMKPRCTPNIGTINTMLKVYSRNDMFSEAKLLFDEIKGPSGVSASVLPDEYTYSAMLEASASALQWEYFEHVYKEMVFSGYQLNQSKHASLLVEASRAGKGHLLDHAFEAILESEEIPHPSWFVEMVFQATAQHNYERAVVLVNTMAYAPFQVTEKQWRDAFDKNGSEVTRENLKCLLDALDNSDVASEVTVLNLSRSLYHLCRGDTSRNLSSSITSDTEDVDEYSCLYAEGGETNGSVAELVPSYTNTGESTGSGEELMPTSAEGEDEDSHSNKASVTCHSSIEHQCSSNGEGDDSRDLGINPDGITNAEGSLGIDSDGIIPADANTGAYDADDMTSGCADEQPLNFMSDEPSKDDYVNAESASKDDDLHTSKLPAAHEILDAWKESRKEDGIFFPFEPAQKKVLEDVQTN